MKERLAQTSTDSKRRKSNWEKNGRQARQTVATKETNTRCIEETTGKGSNKKGENEGENRRGEENTGNRRQTEEQRRLHALILLPSTSSISVSR
jgi:hypothetical protein